MLYQNIHCFNIFPGNWFSYCLRDRVAGKLVTLDGHEHHSEASKVVAAGSVTNQADNVNTVFL